MRIIDLVNIGISELSAAGVPDCTTDVYLLLGHCLNTRRTVLLANGEEVVANGAEQDFYRLLKRRKNREPLAYILGEQEFWSRNFHVSPAVLIPRPETEFLLETVLSHRQELVDNDGVIIDLCCGSGVIAIILALELQKEILAIDISLDALQVTRRNCTAHGVEGLVQPLCGNLLSLITPGKNVSLIVSNPPYVSTHAIHHEVEPEVGEYEPKLALDGGPKGLDAIARIRLEVEQVLLAKGQLFMEIGSDQGQEVKRLFSQPHSGEREFSHVDIIKDYAGRDRVLHAIIS